MSSDNHKPADTNSDDITDWTLTRMRDALAAGAVSAVEVVEAHLAKIDALNGEHNAVLVTNPDALEIARACDAERAAGQLRGPLHGVPILVKDNLDSGDKMATTAGSLALANTHASADSTVVARLRAAGAVLLGKTNLSEWANFRSPRSSSGWSSVGGQVRNACDVTRTPGGSSSGSGVATALHMCAGAIGTETDGSIVGPSAMNGVVGIKPTVGLVSRAGIIPISASQDTAGPMTRSVRDGALMLGVIAGRDERDRATLGGGVNARAFEDIFDSFDPRGLRIGIVREYLGYHDRLDDCFGKAVEVLESLGCEMVPDVEVGSPDTVRVPERVVMETEFKHGLNAYLATRSPGSAPADLAEIIKFNNANAADVMPHYGQELLVASQARGALSDEEYMAARRQSLELAGANGIDRAMREHRLDAIIGPTTAPAWVIDWISGDNRKGSAACAAAVAGYPHVTVPMGKVEHLPVGLSIISGAHRDPLVIGLAHAFEQRLLGES
jgi:amidase